MHLKYTLLEEIRSERLRGGGRGGGVCYVVPYPSRDQKREQLKELCRHGNVEARKSFYKDL